MPQGNNIRENLYNPCSKNSVGKTNTFLNEHGLDGLNGFLFAYKHCHKAITSVKIFIIRVRKTLLVQRTRI